MTHLIPAVRDLIRLAYAASGRVPPRFDDRAIAEALGASGAVALAEDPMPAPQPAEAVEAKLEAETATGGEVALGNRDGERVEQLLARAKQSMVETLNDLAEDAVARLLLAKAPLRAGRLFNEQERSALAEALAGVEGTAELLGRTKVRLRQKQAEALGGARRFSDEPTDWTAFDDRPLRPFTPERALRYFLNLVPKLGVDPEKWGDDQRRSAFTLAVQTDEVVLGRVQAIIAGILETGEGLSDAPHLIEKVLDGAGISPKNPQYCELVARTNLMDAYNTGAQEERKLVADSFPCWKYVGIADGREGDDHRPHFGKYFAADVPFTKVRDSIKVRPWNCRCMAIEVYREDWRVLYAAGARLSRVN